MIFHLVDHKLHAGRQGGYVSVQANVGPEGPGTGLGAGNWVRLPFQAVFIVWAWWYTRD